MRKRPERVGEAKNAKAGLGVLICKFTFPEGEASYFGSVMAPEGVEDFGWHLYWGFLSGSHQGWHEI